MLDPRLIKNNLVDIAAALDRRGVTIDTEKIQQLEYKKRLVQTEMQRLQALRNTKSKEIGRYKKRNEDAQALLNEVAQIKAQLDSEKKSFDHTQAELEEILQAIPNIPDVSVPAGNSAADNKTVRVWGERPSFNFTVRDHVELGNALNMMNFDAASQISGSRFVVMQGAIARLHRALAQFMLDTHSNENAYEEIYVPYLVNADSCFATGQLPKFEQDLFCVSEHGLYLIPTAEVPVTNMMRSQVLDVAQLPKKYVCHSPCFRSEAGSYGKDTRGMMRQHQFDKVELVQFVMPASSYDALEGLTRDAEMILQKLNLPYRTVLLCGGDLGFSAAKTYDIEVWLPGQKKYREIASCSNFEAFQARRMQARWRNPGTRKLEFLHTLNGSGLAVGRALIAVIENYQDQHGRIHIPAVLQPYMGGAKLIQ